MMDTRIGGGLIGGALLLLLAGQPARAQVSIGIGLPTVSIGIHLPIYPELVLVPGYPVYYAPEVSSNYFFYDGMYWVYERDRWYASSWYDGPWGIVEPGFVPMFLLRVPVRYYRQPPRYFRGWGADQPPHWGEHWGRDWERQRRGWDRWDRRSAPRAAPLPIYQRPYSRDRYPRRVEEQETLRSQRYRYQPSEPVVRQHYEARQRPSRASEPKRDAIARPSLQSGQRKQQAQPAAAPRRAQPDPRTATAERQPQRPPPKSEARHEAPRARTDAKKRTAGADHEAPQHENGGNEGRSPH